MTATSTPTSAAVPTQRTKPLAVVVAMKPQLRGRIRRNVETLLEEGMEVVVLTVPSRKDLFVGLDHPELSAERVPVVSTYSRYVAWRARSTRKHARRRQLGPQRLAYLRRAWALRRSPRRLATHLSSQPRYAAGLGVFVTPFPTGWPRLLFPAVAVCGLVARRPRPSASTAPAPAPADVAVPSAPRPTTPTATAVPRSGVEKTYRVALRFLHPLVRTWRGLRTWALGLVEKALLPTNRMERFFVFWRDSRRRVEALRPHLVVSSDLPGLVGASRAAATLGIGQYHDCHELYLESTTFTWYERAVLKPIERRHMRRCERVVAVNRSIADEYARRYGVRPLVVRNCADMPATRDVQDLRQAAGLPADASVVLYQGGFSVGRGLDVCIRAMPLLPDDVHLVMLGYGPMQGELEQLAEENGVAGRVHVLPAVLPEDLLALTASASVGLIPYQPVSKNNFYSLPNKIFEYTSVGVPVVASDLPELRNIAKDAGCGDVYDPFDPESLAAALTRVLGPEAHEKHRRASEEYGAANTWVQEREIVVEALREVARVGRSRVAA